MSDLQRNAPAVQKQQILKAISSDVDLPPVSRSYVMGLLLTAAGVLLLPLLYLAVIALACGCIVAFVRQSESLMLTWPPVLKGLTIVGAVTCGILFVLGLLKPFLARSSAVKRPRALRRDAEPLLYEYVNRLCDSLGAPRPISICITCDLNAGAESRQSWLGWFGGRGMTLHLGLPLIAGLTLRQFTGVVAHELGHFTQRTAMWLENIVRRTTNWFVNAAYERDSIDDWLHRKCADGGLAAIGCRCVLGVVWISRWVLRALAHAGAIISCRMSREMEFNADRCEVRMVGPRTLAATLWRMRQLSVAHQLSFLDVVSFYQEGRLPDDMIALAVANTNLVTPKVKKRLHRMLLEQKTGLFDSHPSDRDRIQAAMQDGSTGLDRSGPLSNKLPATFLFSQFEKISKAATLQFYEEALRRPISPKLLHPVEKLLERQRVEIEGAKALRRYFQTTIPPLRPLPIAPQSTDEPDDPDEITQELKNCRERMIAELPNYKRLTPRYQTAEETFFETIAAHSLLQAGLPFKPSDYHFIEANTEVVADKQTRAKHGVENLAGKLLPFETEAGNRLSFALQLLHIPSVVDKVPQGDDLTYEIGTLLPEAQYVSRLIGELPSLRIVFHRLMTVAERFDPTRPNPQSVDVIVNQMQNLRSRLVSIQREMVDHLYPFDHAQATTTLQAFALPQIPDARDLQGLVMATDQMQSRLTTIQMRLFARLAQAAERIEQAIGMPPLSEPEETDEG